MINGQLRGDDTQECDVVAEAGQTLSVDLSSSNASLYFNILPKDDNEVLFGGSTRGDVADIAVPSAGTYVVQVCRIRGATGRSL